MNEYLRIERIPYEDPHHLHLVWSVSNGNVTSRFDYYDNADSLYEIGKNLEIFPKDIGDVFVYEIGSEKPTDRFAYYFRLGVQTTDSRGTSAIEIKFSNNGEIPYRETVEFCVQTEPAAINRLGALFKEFAKLEQEYMAWSNSESFIGSKLEHNNA